MNTKYQELKNQIKANAELTRIIKKHRKTVHFEGERVKNLKVQAQYRVWDFKNEKWIEDTKEFVIPELAASIAQSILNDYGYSIDGGKDERGYTKWYRVVNPSKENAYLFQIYGILRNERKTKKVKVWEDLINEKWYKGSELEKDVNNWRDEETVCTDK